MFRRFVKDDQGSANLWVAFCILAFFAFAALLYNIHTVYSKYYVVQNELTRCASISLDSNIRNARLRDVITDMEYQPVSDVLEQNLTRAGWTREGTDWSKYEGGRLVYKLTDLSASVSGSNLHLSATLKIPLPWQIAESLTVSYPLELYAKILYIN